MVDNQFWHFSSWMTKLFVTNPRSVPKRLRKIWLLFWSGTLVLIGIIVFIYFQFGYNGIEKFFKSTIFSIPLIIFGKWILNLINSYVGDAGRYLFPKPINIESRYKIRNQGVEFLKKLHEKTNNYDRIILVGHSLGSVVGYDLLKILWPEFNNFNLEPKINNQSEIKQENLDTINLMASGQECLVINKYQTTQSKCLEEFKKIGLKWKITDFITLGSPLGYLDYLTSQLGRLNKHDDLNINECLENLPDSNKIKKNTVFNNLVNQREFPISPPIPELTFKQGIGKMCLIYFEAIIKIRIFREVRFKVLHHAGVFAVTKWTNIFFKSDSVGGPLNIFGEGINNISIPKKSFLNPIAGHTEYWKSGNKVEDQKALEKICAILRVE